MKKSNTHFFSRGMKLSYHYYNGSAFRRIVGFLYSFGKLIGTLLFFAGVPLFAQADFNFGRMLDESGDGNVPKSFDGAEEPRKYLSLCLYNFLMTLAFLAWTGAMFGLGLLLTNVLSVGVAGNMSRTIYLILVYIVLVIFALIVDVPILLMGQTGAYCWARNKALSLGDIAYNAFLCVKNHGLHLLWINVRYILLFVVTLAPFIAGGIILSSIAMRTNLPILFLVLSYLVYALMILFLIFFEPQILTAWSVSKYCYLSRTYVPNRYIAIYARKSEENGDKADPNRGKIIEILPLEDEEGHPTLAKWDQKKEEDYK